MRVLFFLVVSTLAHLLAARWLLSVSPGARRRKRTVLTVAVVLAAVLATLRLVGRWFHGPLYVDVFAVAMIELTVILISLPPLGIFAAVARSIARAFDAVAPQGDDDAKTQRISRREALEQAAGVSVATAATVALGWGVVRGRHSFTIDEVPIKIVGWPRALDGYVIAQVSDIHVGAFVGDRELDEGFELVRRVRPDLVVATGDLVDGDADAIFPLLERLVRVGARDGAFTILGNHDHYAGARVVAERIAASPVGILHNASARIRPGDGGGFALLGVDDLGARKRPTPGFTGPDLGRALAGLPPELPSILLAHQPQYFHEAQGRIGLQLSGHTHGGQINPGFRPADVVMDFVAGRYERAGSTLYVNRGYGVTGPPARIAAPPEVTKLVILAG